MGVLAFVYFLFSKQVMLMAYNHAYQHWHSAMSPCCCINTTAKSREFIFKARETDPTMTVFYYIDMMSVSLLPEMHVYMGGC